ncbi:Protein-disulfide isomerase [Natronoarchaeum philippinense]|uniref:Protein-disulfide isomerase n=1 Tax=Natronoarchaeum philippinense TaxID=558529 RepID=A0A285P7A0_NATPI|nr:thioredoxin domain-containing protein [Natronoarchaeum philippinense]SNZ17604.1 Protein-disulfide isomerase [Natronoarchaeum philippinense]
MSSHLSRRRVLSLAGAGAVGALAGCLSLGDTPQSGDNAPDSSGDNAPDPSGDAVESLPTPVQGDPESSVTVAVYEDFSCPHCRTLHLNTYPDIVSEFVESDRIRYEHHDFPIPVDERWSWGVAGAARAVQDEVGDDAFFEYAALAFEEQGSYSVDVLADLAGQVDAPADAVRAAVENNTYSPVLEADRNAALERGVRGTPTVFVDDEQVDLDSGDSQFAAIRSAIEAAESE